MRKYCCDRVAFRGLIQHATHEERVAVVRLEKGIAGNDDLKCAIELVIRAGHFEHVSALRDNLSVVS